MRGDATRSDERLLSEHAPSVRRVETRVALRYPNGRVAERSLTGVLKIGDSFALYGHRWIAERWTGGSSRRSAAGRVPRLVCVRAD
jgi:hypothetical protein